MIFDNQNKNQEGEITLHICQYTSCYVRKIQLWIDLADHRFHSPRNEVFTAVSIKIMAF